MCSGCTSASWVENAAPWISPQLWQAAQTDAFEAEDLIDGDGDLFVGIDLSLTTDLSRDRLTGEAA